MTAHAPTRSTPRPAPGDGGARLPWWAVALPALAFAVLLSLTAGGEAAAQPPQDLARLLEHLREFAAR